MPPSRASKLRYCSFSLDQLAGLFCTLGNCGCLSERLNRVAEARLTFLLFHDKHSNSMECSLPQPLSDRSTAVAPATVESQPNLAIAKRPIQKFSNIAHSEKSHQQARHLFLSHQNPRSRFLSTQRLSYCRSILNADGRPLLSLIAVGDLSRHKQGAMITSIVQRLMSTVKGVLLGDSLAIGDSIADEQQILLSNSRGNKQVTINVCGKVYAELSKKRPDLYGWAPKNVGINFNVSYYDSLGLIKSGGQVDEASLTTVCLLHGAPGHYKDYASLINYLTLRGIRVIAPNFPDYSATFEYSFRHSPQERMDYLLEFLRAINVHKLDMIAGHSSAVYTMFELLEHCFQSPEHEGGANERLVINSLGLFSTPSYNLPPNLTATPFRMLTLKLFDYSIFRPIITGTIETFARLQGIQNRVDKNKIENLLIAASAMGYSDHEKMSERLHMVVDQRIPTLLVYGTNDRLIPTTCFEQLSHDLGVRSADAVKFYNSDGTVQRDVIVANKLVHVSQFEGGGHYAFQRYSRQVNGDVYRFLLEKVLRSQIDSTKL